MKVIATQKLIHSGLHVTALVHDYLKTFAGEIHSSRLSISYESSDLSEFNTERVFHSGNVKTRIKAGICRTIEWSFFYNLNTRNLEIPSKRLKNRVLSRWRLKSLCVLRFERRAIYVIHLQIFSPFRERFYTSLDILLNHNFPYTIACSWCMYLRVRDVTLFLL